MRVVIGRDTRIGRVDRGGLRSEGATVVSAGIVPTPAIAHGTDRGF
jgi:phosphomannomutase